MARTVPKLSGLVKMGSVVPSSEEAAQGLPNFHFGQSAAPVEETTGLPAEKADQLATVREIHPEPTARASGNAESGTLMLPLSKLRIHPFNSRTVRTQERIEEVKDMLEDEHIQREPITVVPGRAAEDRGYFYILSGQTRYHAANLAGWTELKAQINASIDPSNHLAFWAASIEHNTSRPETDWDIAIKVKALTDEGVSNEQIQKAARRDQRGLRRLTAMLTLPEQVLTVVKEHPAKLTAYFCDALLDGASLGEDVLVEIATQVVTEGISFRELKDKIDRLIRRKEANKTNSKRSTRIAMVPVLVGAKKHGEFKIMQSRTEGKRLVTLSADLPENLVESFRADVEAALSKLAAQALSKAAP